MRWEMYMMATPSARSFLMIRKRCPTSFSVRDEVGSSMMMIFDLNETALAISIDWILETERLTTHVVGSMSIWSSSNTALVSWSIFLLLTNLKGPKPVTG